MPDIKGILEEYVATANSGKYKSFDEVNAKFPELKDYDKGVLEEYVATANSGKYKSFDEVNAKFPEFFGVKKKDLSKGSQEPLAGPYAIGQKPKTFGEIVSERIADTAPEIKAAKNKPVKVEREKHWLEPIVEGLITGSADVYSKLAKGVAVLSTPESETTGFFEPVKVSEEEKARRTNVENKLMAKEAEGLVSKKQAEKQAEKYSGSAWEAFKNGDIKKGLQNASAMVSEAIPTSIALATGAGATIWSIGNVNAEKEKLMKEGYDENTALLSANIKTGLELVTEELAGGAKVLRNYTKTLGKQAAEQAIKKTVKESLVKKLGKDVGENVIGELTNQIGSNLTETYVEGRNDVPWYNGLGDTAIAALGMSSTLAPLTFLTNKNNNKQAELQSQSQPINTQQDAIQESSTSSENAPIGETGQNITESNSGVRQSEQGNEPTETRTSQEEQVIASTIESIAQEQQAGNLDVIDIQTEQQVDLSNTDITEFSPEQLAVVTPNGEYTVAEIIDDNLQQEQPTPTKDVKSVFAVALELNNKLKETPSSRTKEKYDNYINQDPKVKYIMRNFDNILSQLNIPKPDCL